VYLGGGEAAAEVFAANYQQGPLLQQGEIV
jgi:hypothetical protein